MILVIGRGYIGKPLLESLQARGQHVYQFLGDLLNREALPANWSKSLSTVVNCAGLVQAKAQRDPARAAGVNIGAVEQMIELCADNDVRFVHVSTEYVFGGNGQQTPFSTWQATCPLDRCWYGVTKALADRRVSRYTNSLIIRPSVMPEPFPYKQAFTNVISSKLPMADAIQQMADLICADGRTGVAHVCGPPQSIYGYLQSQGVDVEPCRAPYTWTNHHPTYTALK